MPKLIKSHVQVFWKIKHEDGKAGIPRYVFP
jgi:hypothetical protein